ncbi:hypothetical protein DFH08DRAFT_902026, partial [Mycena albidolilacea]
MKVPFPSVIITALPDKFLTLLILSTRSDACLPISSSILPRTRPASAPLPHLKINASLSRRLRAHRHICTLAGFLLKISSPLYYFFWFNSAKGTH